MKNFKNLGQFFLSLVLLLLLGSIGLMASSHREAPLISNDPLADNVDLYAFRSPDNPNTITIIATYVPLQLPHGGPNYYSFGENIRYEIHVDNDASIPGDEITYRFTFNTINEDPTTFFNIRLGAQNLKTTYTLERSMDGGNTFDVIVSNGIVPPNNIGPRSIEGGAGLNTTYATLFQNAITQAATGETVFAGPTDDPFFVDLGGIFDLGDAPRQNGTPTDGVACYNVSAIAIQIPIASLLKTGAPSTPTSILDSDYVIGVWASASRQAITTLSADNDPTYSGDWVQVSRLGMPLTNEAVIAIGDKDYWNGITPYEEISETTLDEYFYNPELALYMDDDLFGGAVPGFAPLRIQTNSLGAFDFSNGADGLFGLKGSPAVAGTALDDAIFGTLLLPSAGKPRSADLWPAFHTGVPNFPPYQLATGKGGNPLAAGKPFVNNFIPNGGDMLRLNMAVPVTPRDDANFSSLGLIQAAAIGLTIAPFNTTADLEFIPNMDGFPNGRRLEDDVTRIELQAVGGVVLAAIGLWYDDYDPTNPNASPVTQDLLNVLTYTTGVEENDRPFSSSFPYLAMPFSGTGDCSGEVVEEPVDQYVVVAFDDLDMEMNKVLSGGVGVVNEDGKAKLDDGTMITANGTFLRAAEITIDGGAMVTDALEEVAMPDLPGFLYNTLDLDNNFEVVVGNGQTVILDQEMYEDVKVGKNATIIFSGNGNVYIEKLETREGATILFDQCTNLIVSGKVKLHKDNMFNPDQQSVYVFAEDEITVKRRTSIYGVMYTMDDFKVRRSSEANEPTELHGIFIGEDVKSEDNASYWYQSFSPCDPPSNIVQPIMANQKADDTDIDNFNNKESQVTMVVYPNPATTTLNVAVNSPMDFNTNLTLVDVNGKQLRSHSLKLTSGTNDVQLDVTDLPGGMYFVLMPQSDGTLLSKRFVVQ